MLRGIKQGSYRGRYFRQERGQVLIYALVIIAIGSLIISGTLTFAGSALKQGSISEDRAAHLYNADAGVESAYHAIRTGSNDLPAIVSDPPMTYSIILEGQTASVNLALVEEDPGITKTYEVTSVSTSTSGKTTTIKARLIALSGQYAYFLDNAFTTAKNIDFKSKIAVNGWVQAGTHTGSIPIWGAGFGWKSAAASYGWPTSTELISYYDGQVANGLANYINGPWAPSGTVSLTQTQYVNGDFTMTGGTLKLNGYTLFVNGNIKIANTSVNPAGSGTGCIIAIGNVEFWPSGDTGDVNNGIFVFSVGTAGAEFQPGNNFYGWIAAQNSIQVKSGDNPSYNWVVPPENLDFPGTGGTGGPGVPSGGLQIHTWDVSY